MGARKQESRHQKAPRVDQLRELNLPRRVAVDLDSEGLPKTVVEHSAPLPLCPSSEDDRLVDSETGGTSGITGKDIEAIIETWRVDDEWWRAPISRRYVEVILAGGKHVVLYEDLTSNDWFMQMP